jgi:hypothetical protein
MEIIFFRWQNFSQVTHMLTFTYIKVVFIHILLCYSDFCWWPTELIFEDMVFDHAKENSYQFFEWF